VFINFAMEGNESIMKDTSDDIEPLQDSGFMHDDLDDEPFIELHPCLHVSPDDNLLHV
jgi:hypothetical protein